MDDYFPVRSCINCEYVTTNFPYTFIIPLLYCSHESVRGKDKEDRIVPFHHYCEYFEYKDL